VHLGTQPIPPPPTYNSELTTDDNIVDLDNITTGTTQVDSD
jgi:hypothetical protein